MTEPDKRSPDAGTPIEFTFERGPCDPARVRTIISRLGHAAPHLTSSGADHLPELLDPEELHRRLLKLIAPLRPHHPARFPIATALGAVNHHSGLFTRRCCDCAEHDWSAFRSSTSRELHKVVNPGWWAVTEGEQQHADREVTDTSSLFDLAALTDALGIGKFDPIAALPARLTIRVLTDAHLEISADNDGEVRTITLRHLPRELDSLVHNLQRDGWDKSDFAFVVGKVLVWPAPARRIAAARYPYDQIDKEDRAALGDWLRQLLDTDMASLTDEQLHIATAIAETFPGSPGELLETARAVAVERRPCPAAR